MMRYSIKKASKHSFIGIVIGALPFVLTLLVSHTVLSADDANALAGIVAVISVAFGTEYSSYAGKKKLADQDARLDKEQEFGGV